MVEAQDPYFRGPIQDSDCVGRELQLQRISGIMEAAFQGKQNLCLIAGEPGSGKSTLLNHALQHSCDGEKFIVLKAQCNAQTGKSDPYLPFVQILREFSALIQEETGASALKEVSKKLDLALLKEAGRLFERLVPGGEAITGVVKSVAEEFEVGRELYTNKGERQNPSLEKDLIFLQYADFLKELCREKALIIALEDLHWSDTSSLDLLFHLLRTLKGEKILFLGTYRPGYIETSPDRSPHTLKTLLPEMKAMFGDVWVDLGNLTEEEHRHFITKLLEQRKVPSSEKLVDALLAHTGGQAMFTQEVLNEISSLHDLGAHPEVDWSKIPTRVEGAIESKFRNVDDQVREILQVASVEGAEFIAQITAKLGEKSEKTVLQNLTYIAAREHHIIREMGTERKGRQFLSRFAFAHTLFQEYLYQDLPESARMLLHQETAEALEELYGDDQASIYGKLAYHYLRCDYPEKAIHYLLKVASHSIRLGSYLEALESLRLAQAQLKKMPEGEERNRLDLEILIPLSLCLKVTVSWSASEVIQCCSRITELSDKLGKTPETVALSYFGLWLYQLLRREFHDCLVTAKELEEKGKSLANDALQVQAQVAYANAYLWLGHWAKVDFCFQRALVLYDPSQAKFHRFVSGFSPIQMMEFFQCVALRIRGLHDQAEELARIAKKQLSEGRDLFERVVAAQTLSWDAWLREEPDETLRFSQKLIELSTKGNFPFYLGIGLFFKAWALVQKGEPEEALILIHQGWVETVSKFGTELQHSIYCLIKVEALQKLSCPTELTEKRDFEVKRILTQEIKTLTQSGETSLLPLFYKAYAEFLQKTGASDTSIRQNYIQALSLNLSQDSQFFGLSCANSFANYLLEQDRGEEALQTLHPYLSQGLSYSTLLQNRRTMETLAKIKARL